MSELVTRLVPIEAFAPLIVAVLLWGGVCFLLAPEVARREAAKKHLPQCVATVEEDQRRYRADYDARRTRLITQAKQRIEQAKRRAQAEAARVREQTELLKGMAKGFLPSELLDALGRIPQLKALEQGTDAMLALQSLPKSLDITLPDIPKPLPPASKASRESYCGCIVGAAIKATRLDYTLYTMSVRAYRPPSIQHFDGTMRDIMQAKKCGLLPLR